MVPEVELPPVTPFTFQTTLVLAVNWRVRLRRTLAEVGVIETVSAGVMVTVADPAAS